MDLVVLIRMESQSSLWTRSEVGFCVVLLLGGGIIDLGVWGCVRRSAAFDDLMTYTMDDTLLCLSLIPPLLHFYLR
jgi:hypothetical protein